MKRPGLNMRYESGTNYIFLILQMLVKCCFLEAITKYCGSGVELHHICDHLCNQKMFDVLWMMYDVIRDG